MKPIPSILLWICCALSGHTQQLRFVNVSNVLQIPSPVCYNIMADHKGYIWIGTDAGLCRYDGTDIKIFDGRNGLPEASIYEMVEDPNHNMWLATSRSRILTYVNDSLIEAPFNKKYVKAVGEFDVPFKMNFIDESRVYINSKSYTFLADIGKNTLTGCTSNDSSNYFFSKENGIIIPIRTSKQSHSDTVHMTVKLNRGITKKIIFSKKDIVSGTWRTQNLSVGNTDFISLENFLIKFEGDSYSVIRLPSRILHIHVDKRNRLWVGTYKSGLFYYPDYTDPKNPVHSLQTLSISSITEDKEGGIWCSSLESGVYYCNNNLVIDYSNIDGLNKPVDLLKNVDGKVYAASDGAKLFEIDDAVTEHRLSLKSQISIADIIKTGAGWLITGQHNTFRTDHDFKRLSVLSDVRGRFFYGYQFTEDEEKHIDVISYNYLVEINRKNIYMKSLPFPIPGRKILYKGNDEYYIGTDVGLYLLHKPSFTAKKILGNTQITKIIRDSGNNIWFSTKGEGLFLMTDTAHYNISRLLSIPTDFFYDIVEDRYHNIWAGTNIGLLRLSRADGKYSYSVYSMLDGIPSNIIHKVAANREYVFASTTEGLIRVPINTELKNTVPPEIYLRQTLVDGKPVKVSENKITLPYNRNSLRLSFDVISYRNFTQKKLFYTLEGKETKSQSADGNEIVLDNMEPGTYELEVFGLNDDGIYSRQPIRMDIAIGRPFWETAGFILLSAVIFCVVLYYSVKSVIDRIKAREEAKTQINKMVAEYQLSALQAQMKPHFIFNAINSIQSYILQKNEEQAYDYLAKFSKLIRKVLNNSEEKILTLQQELETLDLYIQLEQLRFDNKFEYILRIADDVSPQEISVPAMLIQPYVENAIWHGLMNLNGSRKGMLYITIGYVGDELIISVEDNGVGRAFAMGEKKQRNHTSIGMKLNEKRLMMLNQLRDFENARVEIIDLYDDSGKARGTKVNIHIPVK